MNEVQAFVSALHVDGTERVACPSCSPTRKKFNAKEMVVTRMPDAWVYHCHHCGLSGNVQFEKPKFVESKLSAVPNPVITQSALTDAHYEFLKTRGISKETANKMQLFAAEKWFARLNKASQAIGFPYYRNGALTAAKYRSIENKDFTQDNWLTAVGDGHCERCFIQQRFGWRNRQFPFCPLEFGAVSVHRQTADVQAVEIQVEAAQVLRRLCFNDG